MKKKQGSIVIKELDKKTTFVKEVTDTIPVSDKKILMG